MTYLIDTNVISEFSKRRPHASVAAFLAGLSAESVWLSVLTLGEIRRGVERERPRDPMAADSIQQWLWRTEARFVDRILPVTAEIAHRWGEMSSDRTRPVTDTLIAATASVHGLTVVTRNERDYRDLGVRVVNPWR